MDKLYLVDALNILFRSYHAIRAPFTNKKGEPTNALYGFVRSINKIIKEHGPSHIAIIFDGPGNKESRQAIFAAYKQNRPPMPEDLRHQMAYAKAFCKAAHLPILEVPGHEADDVIGTLAVWSEKKGSNTYIISSDKDLAQLITDHTFMINPSKDNLLIDKLAVKEIYGVHPNQIPDLLGLMGDSSDNIPGVPGVGPKTAITFIEEFESIENLLKQSGTGKKWDLLKEHADSAILSKKLATILIDDSLIPTLTEDFFTLKNGAIDELRAFYTEMDFKTLLAELPAAKEVPSAEEKPLFHVVNSEKEIADLIANLMGESTLVFDTETTSIEPMESLLVGIGLKAGGGPPCYIPMNGAVPKKRLLDLLKLLFENPNIAFCGHNIKFDIHTLLNEGICVAKIGFDTMIASYLLSPQEPRHGLDHLSALHFDKTKIPITDLIGKGKEEISMSTVPLEKISEYCCEDVEYTAKLQNLFEPQLKNHEKLYQLFKTIELPLIPVLIKMERAGIFVDREKLAKMSYMLTEKLALLEAKVQKEAGHAINLNSPKQVAELLFNQMGIHPLEKTATGYSTSAEVLEKLRDNYPIAGDILDYRLLEKLRSTYVDSLPEQINKETGKIHCTFMQTVAATGRLSCQSPNLQNIPTRSEEGRKIREAFRPEKAGFFFLAADYSQIELRLLAHMSEDPYLIDAFTRGFDVHIATAALIFGCDIKEVTLEMRQQAKAVNFGVIYGQQAFGLSKGQGITFAAAKEFIKKYFDRLPGVKRYIDDAIATAKSNGYSETLTGRRRPIPELSSKNPALRGFGERLAVNSPLQGTNADLIKIAMIRIQKRIESELKNSHMLLQIHDELLFEVIESEILALETLVKEEMEGVISLKVPLLVDIKIGKNWGEC